MHKSSIRAPRARELYPIVGNGGHLGTILLHDITDCFVVSPHCIKSIRVIRIRTGLPFILGPFSVATLLLDP